MILYMHICLITMYVYNQPTSYDLGFSEDRALGTQDLVANTHFPLHMAEEGHTMLGT